jgi:hypothetical protein
MINAKINIQWLLPIMHNIPTTSLPNVLFPNHLGTKKTSDVFSFTRVFPISPFFFSLLTFLPTYLCCPFMFTIILLHFLSLTTTSCPMAFFFTFSWSSPWFFFVIFHLTRRHIEQHTFYIQTHLKLKKV